MGNTQQRGEEGFWSTTREYMSAPLSYSELVKDSLMGGSGMENGLQTTAIYWEAWSTSFSGLFGGVYGSKWSWKVMDDEIRQRFGVDGADTKKHDAFVFAPGDRQYVRKYAGDADIYDVVPTKKSAVVGNVIIGLLEMDTDSPLHALELRQDDVEPLSPGGTMADALLEEEREFKPFVKYYDAATYESRSMSTVSTQTEEEEAQTGGPNKPDTWFNGLPQSNKVGGIGGDIGGDIGGVNAVSGPVPQTKRRKYIPAAVEEPLPATAAVAEDTTVEAEEPVVSQRAKAAHEYSDVVEEELLIDDADIVPEGSTEEFVVVQDDMGRDRKVRPDSETYKRYRRITATRKANELAAATGEVPVATPIPVDEERPEVRQAKAARGVIAYDDL